MSRVLPVAPTGSDAPADAIGGGPDRVEEALQDPFADMPPVKTIALRVVVGVVVLIGSLAIVGTFISSASFTDGLRKWDESINVSLAENRSSGVVDVAELFTGMADTRPILGIMALITLTLALCRQWKAMLLIPVAMLVEISGFLAVDYIVGRPRPNVDKIGPLPGTYSFPSGHVAATLVCWLGAALLLLAFGRHTPVAGDGRGGLGDGRVHDLVARVRGNAPHTRRRDGIGVGDRRARHRRQVAQYPTPRTATVRRLDALQQSRSRPALMSSRESKLGLWRSPDRDW